MIYALDLFLLVAAFRVLMPIYGPENPALWVNFSPLAALALCGAYAFPRVWAWALPLLALLVSDLILNAWYEAPLFGVETAFRLLPFLLLCAAGWWLSRRNAKTYALLPTAAAGSAFFYATTCTLSWLMNPAYQKTAAGWAQALTIGEAGVVPPAWVFFRNALISDLLFTALFILCLAAGCRLESQKGPQDQARPAPEAQRVS